ncbi:MAG: NAD(P)/FAD-dependent oxidoreductase [Anaerolineae bacterium]
MTRYLIIGNSSGGIGAAEAIRQLDRLGPVTMVSEEPLAAYSRPLIARYLTGETTLERMAYRPARFYQELGIRLLTGHPLAELRIAEREAVLADGQVLPYDRLLLAVGGTPIAPPIDGLQDCDWFTFTTLSDAQALAAHLPGKRAAVVVGGGLIGLSVSEALVRRGLQVTIVELAPHILGRALDARAASLVRRALETSGVRVFTGRSVASIGGSRRQIQSVTLDDGAALPCDTLVVAIGVRPRTEVVQNTPIAVQRGIVVDRRMATSCSDVYACGDVAEAYDYLADANRVTPIWPNAFLGGRVAGRNMAGTETLYSGGTAMNSLHSFGLSIMSAGIVDPPAGDSSFHTLQREDAARGLYRKLVLRDGRVVGMIFAGAIERAGIVFGLMKDGVDVSPYAERLLEDNLTLLSLPEERRRCLLHDMR